MKQKHSTYFVFVKKKKTKFENYIFIYELTERKKRFSFSNNPLKNVTKTKLFLYNTNFFLIRNIVFQFKDKQHKPKIIYVLSEYQF